MTTLISYIAEYSKFRLFLNHDTRSSFFECMYVKVWYIFVLVLSGWHKLGLLRSDANSFTLFYYK